MTTGEPYVAQAMAAQHDRNGRRETVYWDFVYVPMPDEAGIIDGVMVVASEVTGQVQARRQLEQLTQELELRVTARSAETKAALFEAEQQREQAQQQQARLGQILGQMPAAIATLSGPTHRFAYFNAAYQAPLWLHRTGPHGGRGVSRISGAGHHWPARPGLHQRGALPRHRNPAHVQDRPPASPSRATWILRISPCSTRSSSRKACWCLPWT